MVSQAPPVRRFRRRRCAGSVSTCHAGWALFALAILWTPSLSAQTVPWGVQVVSKTGIRWADLGPVISRSGDLYIADSRSDVATVRKVSASGRQVFEVQIPGAGRSMFHMILAGDGNVYINGYADKSLPVTQRAYVTSGPGNFACGLSGSDGHILFCTYVDVPGYPAFAADSQGNVYLAPRFVSQGYALKLRPDGGLAYRVELTDVIGPISIAPNANGNLLIAGTGAYFLMELDPAGKVVHTTQRGANGYVSLIALHASGNPQVLIKSGALYGPSKVRRYSNDLSAILFETELNRFEPSAMWLDSAGATVIAGETSSVDFQQLHPTASCTLPAKAQTYPPNSPRDNTVLVRLDRSGRLVQSTFLARAGGPTITGYIDASGGMLVLDDGALGEYVVTSLGPMPEVRFGCMGNAAALNFRPLAPEELVSIFGQGMGPASPAIGLPGADNRYPAKLAGVQVTFDDVAAPLCYASGNQINAVTPRSLAGRGTTRVCVLVDGVRTNCIDAPVRPASPGIFTSSRDSYYPFAGLAAAINQDGTINSKEHPAPVGSVVSIFATGCGTITPALEDGEVVGLPLPSQDLPVRVYVVAGVDKNTNSYRFATVPTQYAGPAPMQIKGLTQINLEVPANGELMFVQLGEFGQSSTATDLGFRLWIKR